MKIHMRGPKTESTVRSSKVSVFLKMGTEAIIEEKTAENFLKLLKDTYTEIQ